MMLRIIGMKFNKKILCNVLAAILLLLNGIALSGRIYGSFVYFDQDICLINDWDLIKKMDLYIFCKEWYSHNSFALPPYHYLIKFYIFGYAAPILSIWSGLRFLKNRRLEYLLLYPAIFWSVRIIVLFLI